VERRDPADVNDTHGAGLEHVDAAWSYAGSPPAFFLVEGRRAELTSFQPSP
jgi:hypothetical protein